MQYLLLQNRVIGTFNFLASMFYTQVFAMIDENAKKCGGSLATSLEIYMDEWAQLGEIPRFIEELAYLRGLNVGITIGLQSLSQLKKRYKDNWESVLDCVDSTLFLRKFIKRMFRIYSFFTSEKRLGIKRVQEGLFQDRVLLVQIGM